MIKYEGGVIRIKEILQELSGLSYDGYISISTPQKKEQFVSDGRVGNGIYKQTTFWGRHICYDLEHLKSRNKRLAELYIKELTIRLSWEGRIDVCISAQKESCTFTVNVDDLSATKLRKMANHLDFVNSYFEKGNLFDSI